MVVRCTNCGVNVLAKSNYVKFECPACGKEVIVRCNTCKTSSSKYTCPNPACGFTGP